MTNADVPLCEVCEEAPAEGTFWHGTPVCRSCADCAIDDGHMAARDFVWWTPIASGRTPPGGSN